MIATILRIITNSVDKYLKYRRISIQLYKLLHLEKNKNKMERSNRLDVNWISTSSRNVKRQKMQRD